MNESMNESMNNYLSMNPEYNTSIRYLSKYSSQNSFKESDFCFCRERYHYILMYYNFILTTLVFLRLGSMYLC